MLKNDLVLALIEQFDKDLSAIELASKSAGGIFDALLSARDHLEESKKVMFAFSDSESRPSSPGDGNSEESMQEEASNSNSVDDNNDVKSQSEETLANDPKQLANDEQEAAPEIILNDNNQPVQTEEGKKAESPAAEDVSANTKILTLPLLKINRKLIILMQLRKLSPSSRM